MISESEVVLISASRHVAFYLLTKGFTCTTWSTSHTSRRTKSSGTDAQKFERDTFNLKRSDNSTGSPVTVSFCNDFSSPHNDDVSNQSAVRTMHARAFHQPIPNIAARGHLEHGFLYKLVIDQFSKIDLLFEEVPVWNMGYFQFNGISFKEN